MGKYEDWGTTRGQYARALGAAASWGVRYFYGNRGASTSNATPTPANNLRKRKRVGESTEPAAKKPKMPFRRGGYGRSRTGFFRRRRGVYRRRPFFKRRVVPVKLVAPKRRRTPWTKLKRKAPGLAMPGRRLVKMRFVSTCTIQPSQTAGESDKLTPFDAKIKANSIYNPFVAASSGENADAKGSDRVQGIYRKYRVVKSSLFIQSLRTGESTTSSSSPILVGVNLTQNAANNQRGTNFDAERGVDLSVVGVDLRRDKVLAASDLMKSCRPRYFGANPSAFQNIKCKYSDRRFFKGTKTAIEERTGLLHQDSGTAGTFNRPGDPTQVVYFQPWCCDGWTTNGTAGNLAIRAKITATYWLVASERTNNGYDYDDGTYGA